MNKQNGFSPVITLLLLLVIAAAGVAAWFSLQRNPTDSSSAAPQSQKSADTEKEKIDTSVVSTNLVVTTAADIAKLPSSVPESFKSYLSGLVDRNDNGRDCVGSYSFKRVSQFNIQGGVSSVPLESDKPVDGCDGGEPLVWAINKAGQWDSTSANDIDCKTLGGAPIYSEFAPECFVNDADPDPVKNPNGSIKSLAT